jgi:choline dehydrogenase-like flavoprotein
MPGYDYIVVGGGSAGCVLAARLSENPDVRVLLLEAGGRDTNPYIHMPVGFAKMTTGPLTWGLTTVPQTHANNRVIPYAQARVLGGGSSINAEIYTRGHPSDYDRWEREGATGWAFDAVKPWFLKAEGNTILSGDWHGTDGPLGVSTVPDPDPLSRAFVRSCQEIGMEATSDFNGPRPAGTGIYQTTTKNNRRSSAAVAYLRPAKARPNLTVVTGALVHRIDLEGARAVGVTYATGGTLTVARADSEVIVTSGAINSPKLLMLSGIGPADHLRAIGVDTKHDLPGVGANLNDHFGIDIVAELKDHGGLDKYRKLHWMAWAGLQYLMFNAGPVTTNVVEGGAFWHSDRANGEGKVPDLQFHFLPGAGAEAGVPSVPKGTSGITLNSYALRPKARGTVRLASGDVTAKPLIDPNFLSEAEDLRLSTEGVKMSREIFGAPSLAKHIRRVHFPSDEVKTQAQFEAFARAQGRTSYHPVGTCKMGVDAMSVVSPDCRVHGIDGLRVADSSIMPSLVGSNTNAPSIMIGEKAADLIRGNH